MSHKVTIYRYEDDGAKIKVHITDKFDCEKEAERFAYADPLGLCGDRRSCFWCHDLVDDLSS